MSSVEVLVWISCDERKQGLNCRVNREVKRINPISRSNLEIGQGLRGLDGEIGIIVVLLDLHKLVA